MDLDFRATVLRAVDEAPVVDMHTHLYPPSFGDLLLSGVDELLTYHYLIAETARVSPLGDAGLTALSQREQADEVWQRLFVDRSPISEAAMGVVMTLQMLGLDPNAPLEEIRNQWGRIPREERVDRVFQAARLVEVVMTNDPFDDAERPYWLNRTPFDPRFRAALRIDPLLNEPVRAEAALREQGYGFSTSEILRFLDDWVDRMAPLYMAVSLPPDFAFPEDSHRARTIANCVVPTAVKHGIPFAMMIGVRRQVNPRLGLAGDGVGRADLASLTNLCDSFPEARFFCTVLSNENQQELNVAARKFGNLMPFGCWWFVNNPTLVDEITRLRIDMLGLSFIPQHSDARVLEQVVYKWRRSKDLVGQALADAYEGLAAAGRVATEAEIRRDVERLFSRNFEEFVRGAA
ncbi:MAG: glucuronate isomerase [Fimbriimonadaceae bacterium]